MRPQHSAMVVVLEVQVDLYYLFVLWIGHMVQTPTCHCSGLGEDRDHWQLFLPPHRDWHCHGIILIPSKCIIYFCPDSKLELDFCVTQVQAAAEGLDFASSQGLARGIDSALSHLQ